MMARARNAAHFANFTSIFICPKGASKLSLVVSMGISFVDRFYRRSGNQLDRSISYGSRLARRWNSVTTERQVPEEIVDKFRLGTGNVVHTENSIHELNSFSLNVFSQRIEKSSPHSSLEITTISAPQKYTLINCRNFSATPAEACLRRQGENHACLWPGTTQETNAGSIRSWLSFEFDRQECKLLTGSNKAFNT